MPTAEIEALRARLAGFSEGDEDAPERLDALNELAHASRLHDWNYSVEIAGEARRLADRAGNVAARARAGWILLMIAGWQADLPLGLEVGAQALIDYRAIGDRYGEGATLDGLSTIYEDLGDLKTALEYARRASEIAEETGELSRWGWALSSVGGLLSAGGEHEAALRELEKAQSLFERAEDPLGLSRIDLRMGDVHLARGDIESARACLERLSAGHASTHPAGRSALFSALGRLALASGDRDEARRHNAAALELGDQVQGSILVDVGITQAELNLEDGRLDEAADELERALELARTGKSRRRLMAIHRLFAALHERRDDLRAALSHYRRFDEERAAVSSDEARAAVIYERTRHAVEAAEKDAEIHRLRYVELAQMQARLVETERLGALAELAAGVAHELNTPLGVLQSNLDLLETALARIEAGLGDELPPKVERAMRAVAPLRVTAIEALERVDGFVRSVQRFAKLDAAAWQHVRLESCVREVLPLIRSKLRPEVTLHEILEETPAVWANPARINQALTTIVVNASEAIDGAGEITVRVHAEEDAVVVSVSDTGRGMPEDVATDLFDVGFRSEGSRVQMRMGLLAVAATMSAHEGRAEVTSEVGVGTTVHLVLRRQVAQS